MKNILKSNAILFSVILFLSMEFFYFLYSPDTYMKLVHEHTFKWVILLITKMVLLFVLVSVYKKIVVKSKT